MSCSLNICVVILSVVPIIKPRYILLHVAWVVVDLLACLTMYACGLPSGTFNVLNPCIVVCRRGFNEIFHCRFKSLLCYLWVWFQ